MKTRIAIVVLVLALTGIASADQRVNGYYRDSDGDGYKETHVQPYSRTAPDSNPYNNYSTKGNTNPYTGERGTVNPYGSNQFKSKPYNDQYKSYYGN